MHEFDDEEPAYTKQKPSKIPLKHRVYYWVLFLCNRALRSELKRIHHGWGSRPLPPRSSTSSSSAIYTTCLFSAMAYPPTLSVMKEIWTTWIIYDKNFCDNSPLRVSPSRTKGLQGDQILGILYKIWHWAHAPITILPAMCRVNKYQMQLILGWIM